MGKTFQEMLAAARDGVGRQLRRAAAYANRPDVKPEILAEAQKDVCAIEAVLHHPAMAWGAKTEGFIRHALSDPEVGYIILLVVLRPDKTQPLLGEIAFNS